MTYVYRDLERPCGLHADGLINCERPPARRTRHSVSQDGAKTHLPVMGRLCCETSRGPRAQPLPSDRRTEEPQACPPSAHKSGACAAARRCCSLPVNGLFGDLLLSCKNISLGILFSQECVCGRGRERVSGRVGEVLKGVQMTLEQHGESGC